MAARGSAEERAALARAKARLDRLDFHPRPVARRARGSGTRRGCSARRGSGASTATSRASRSSSARPLAEVSDDLIVHELCHVWQEQHGRLRMWLSYLRGYRENPNEVEARRAVALTR